MKCPYCGSENPNGTVFCTSCKKRIQDGTSEGAHGKSRTQKVLIVVAWVIGVLALFVGVNKLFAWYESYQITRLYTRGAYTPSVNEMTMPDGRAGHALVFYGKDGDKVFLPELNRSLSICGGVARLEIGDSDWFGDAANDYDYADITFAPVLYQEQGGHIPLPLIKYRVDVPTSPLEVKAPADNKMPEVVTSSYTLELQTVYGSSMYINGEDVTDRIDRSGYLNTDVSVQPIGENKYTVIVRTPRHKESRQDISIFRRQYPIEIELDKEVTPNSSEDTMAITGRCERGAVIIVDSDYIEESYQMDMETGRFSFIAKLKNLRNNNINFHVSMEGRSDANIMLSVNYKPTLAAYSAKAWKMDYQQLRLYYQTWTGRIFQCKGTVVDNFEKEGKQYIAIDVNPSGEEQLCILENYASTTPVIGKDYVAYADVLGNFFYEKNSTYQPLLACMYIDLDA